MGVMSGIAIGSLIFSAVQQYRQAGAAKKAGEADQRAFEATAEVRESEAAQFDFNAQVAELQAQDALGRGQDEESRFRTSVRGLLGSQRAGFGGQGVDVGFGSAADVQADAAYLGELDALQIRTNAQREAWGLEVQAEDLRAGAATARKGAAAARLGGESAAAAGRAGQSAGRWQAGATLLGGTSSLLLARYGWDRPGSAGRTV